ncbi:MAG: hypothetical protein JSS82_12580 [Bacteroidetes bacterium]|nr:hypothetical protein [Bacteroidota bacterium]
MSKKQSPKKSLEPLIVRTGSIETKFTLGVDTPKKKGKKEITESYKMVMRTMLTRHINDLRTIRNSLMTHEKLTMDAKHGLNIALEDGSGTYLPGTPFHNMDDDLLKRTSVEYKIGPTKHDFHVSESQTVAGGFIV